MHEFYENDTNQISESYEEILWKYINEKCKMIQIELAIAIHENCNKSRE